MALQVLQNGRIYQRDAAHVQIPQSKRNTYSSNQNIRVRTFKRANKKSCYQNALAEKGGWEIKIRILIERCRVLKELGMATNELFQTGLP